MGLVQTFNKIAEAVVNHPLISADRSASDDVVVQLSAFLAQGFLDGLVYPVAAEFGRNRDKQPYFLFCCILQVDHLAHISFIPRFL